MELLTKLINNSDNLTEANAIAMLGTTYKQTGFHFDKRLEKFLNNRCCKRQRLFFCIAYNGCVKIFV